MTARTRPATRRRRRRRRAVIMASFGSSRGVRRVRVPLTNRGRQDYGPMTAPSPAIEVEGLHKAFGEVGAVAGACLRVDRGALFPHLTVGANAAFGAPRRERAVECLDLVGLSGRAGAYPHELSGGERQRVALARALAADPEVILLDEPFAALDAGLRETLREEVAAILREAGASALLVTHDQAEALSLADTVAVLRDGRLEQVGTPEEVYERPQSQWVASFLGDADVLPGTARDGFAECELGRFAVASELEGAVELVVRPESVAIGHRSAGS